MQSPPLVSKELALSGHGRIGGEFGLPHFPPNSSGSW